MTCPEYMSLVVSPDNEWDPMILACGNGPRDASEKARNSISRLAERASQAEPAHRKWR